jgi:EPS-associated MarR family transcriptional regulator
MTQIDKEIHLKLLRHLEANPKVSQRELAKHLGISLGKANYCLQALGEKGLVKSRNFKNSNNKIAYAYILTPKGIKEKAALASRFLQRKMLEYEMLKGEIEKLRQEVAKRS